MKDSSLHGAHTRWVHVVPLVVIVTLAVSQWRPSSTRSARTSEEERIIASLAMTLGSADADAIEAALRSVNHFPPQDTATRALVQGLVSCGTARLDARTRSGLAGALYTITTDTDALPARLPDAVALIRHSLTAVHCAPDTIDAVAAAANAVARRDPNPRRDWW